MTAEFAAAPAPDPAMFGLPTEDDGNRTDPLLFQNIVTCTHYEPDVEALRAASTRIVLAAGVESEGQMAHRGAAAMAERLGTAAGHLPERPRRLPRRRVRPGRRPGRVRREAARGPDRGLIGHALQRAGDGGMLRTSPPTLHRRRSVLRACSLRRLAPRRRRTRRRVRSPGGRGTRVVGLPAARRVVGPADDHRPCRWDGDRPHKYTCFGGNAGTHLFIGVKQGPEVNATDHTSSQYAETFYSTNWNSDGPGLSLNCNGRQQNALFVVKPDPYFVERRQRAAPVGRDGLRPGLRVRQHEHRRDGSERLRIRLFDAQGRRRLDAPPLTQTPARHRRRAGAFMSGPQFARRACGPAYRRIDQPTAIAGRSACRDLVRPRFDRGPVAEVARRQDVLRTRHDPNESLGHRSRWIVRVEAPWKTPWSRGWIATLSAAILLRPPLPGPSVGPRAPRSGRPPSCSSTSRGAGRC